MRRKGVREKMEIKSAEKKNSRTSDFNGLYPNVIQSILLFLAFWFILGFLFQKWPNRYTSQSNVTLKGETRKVPTTQNWGAFL